MPAEHVDEPATDIWARTTAPQSEFTRGQVLTGIVVLGIGLALVAGLPLLLA